MPRIDDLHLHEQLLLLALHDTKGTMQTANFDLGAGGVALAELLLDGHLALEQVKKKRKLVRVAVGGATGDPLLDDVLRRVRAAKRGEQPSTWVQRIARTKRLRHLIAERLRHRGILGKREGRVLFVFTRDTYPTLDPAPEGELVERIRSTVLGDEPAEPRTAILIAVSHHIGLLHTVLTRAERKARKQRLRQLSALDAVEGGASDAVKAVKEVLESQAAAVIAATG